jgi:hypothetical protein
LAVLQKQLGVVDSISVKRYGRFCEEKREKAWEDQASSRSHSWREKRKSGSSSSGLKGTGAEKVVLVDNISLATGGSVAASYEVKIVLVEA